MWIIRSADRSGGFEAWRVMGKSAVALGLGFGVT